ncbi:hypothetical protein [Actinokineospora enzanensis]|uniref:hypothetical protein n=1 Tax=Actinokineospora enzanensis TaxID=155975 RepID=UPI000364D270|nr:hypothetical protein [Actinokineospora enzanensis]
MRKLAVLLATAGLLVATAPAALAYEPVNVVHTEKVQAGPYAVTVGFSAWPVRAMQSLDFTFAVDGGIAGKSGSIVFLPAADPREAWDEPLARHPRQREVWGLDVRAMDEPGDYAMRFLIDGPAGPGVGELADLHVLDQPGPPLGLSWAVSSLPLVGLVVFLVLAWRRTKGRLIT